MSIHLKKKKKVKLFMLHLEKAYNKRNLSNRWTRLGDCSMHSFPLIFVGIPAIYTRAPGDADLIRSEALRRQQRRETLHSERAENRKR
jgi:hypothetical protein